MKEGGHFGGTMAFAASRTLCQGWAPVGGELTPALRGWCVTDHGWGPHSDPPPSKYMSFLGSQELVSEGS